MKYAKLKLDQTDKQKFEIVSSGKGSVRYHLRASHPVEANRWIFALTQAIQAATAESMTSGDDGGSLHTTHSRTTSSSKFPGMGHHSTSSMELKPEMTNMTNSSAASLMTDDESGEDSFGEEPYKADFEVTAHSAKVQLEILEKLLGSIPQRQRSTDSGLDVVEDPIVILKRAASSLHGSLDELVRMSRSRDTYWRNRVEQEKELRRLWEENMETLAEEQEHMEEAMNNAIEQRRVTKRALRALSIAAGGPDNGAEYIRRLSVVERNRSPMPPVPELDNLPPSYQSETLAAAISSDDEDEFFDAIGSESSTIVEQEPPSPSIRPKTATKEKLPKEQELQVSAHGYEGPIRTKFEKLDKDNRPKISLWGILKSMVGKDMTKMVFPQLPSNVDFTGQFQ
jgi:oxysterol-binding protein 1